MIKLEHVSKAYSAGIPALNDVNLEIMMESLFSYAEIADPANPL